MFRSATLQLTGWYLAVLMTMSLVFSAVIYQINFNEINTRLQNLQQSAIEVLPGVYVQGGINQDLSATRSAESAEASRQLLWALVRANLVVLMVGGLASYHFARKTLRPIEQAHEAQSRFTSDASHELRTPLTTMKLELETALSDDKISLEETTELLKSNLAEVENLINISEMMLELSRTALDKDRVNLTDLTKNLIKSNQQANKRVLLKSSKSLYIWANKTAIARLVNILIDNALLYSPKKSPIEIKITVQRSIVKFQIENQSTKISEEQAERIFERFYRADKSRTSGSNKGYGLGLSIAKKIVEEHKGSIRAKYKNGKLNISFYLSQHKR